jgi:heme O synthase-like polyprenyltransferase
MINLLLSLAVIAACILLIGAWRLWRRNGKRGKAALMFTAALVILANIAILTVPDGNGNALIK